jgi:hypothetical protein
VDFPLPNSLHMNGRVFQSKHQAVSQGNIGSKLKAQSLKFKGTNPFR